MRETCTGARKNELAGISSNHCSTKIISWHAGDAAEYLASENHHIFKKTLHSDSKANRTTRPSVIPAAGVFYTTRIYLTRWIQLT